METKPNDNQTVRNENEENKSINETDNTEFHENIINESTEDDNNKIIINENLENLEQTNITKLSEDEAEKSDFDSRNVSIPSQNYSDKSETKTNEYSKEISDNSTEFYQLYSSNDEGGKFLLDSAKYETESSNTSTNIDDLKEIATFVGLEHDTSDISISGLFRDDVEDIINSLMAIIERDEGRKAGSGDSYDASNDKATEQDKTSSKDEQIRLEERQRHVKKEGDGFFIDFREGMSGTAKFIKTSFKILKVSFVKLCLPGQVISETDFILNNLAWRGCLNVWATSALVLQFVLISSLGALWLRNLISWSQFHCAWYFKESLLHLKYKTNRKKYIKYMRRIEQRSNEIPFVDVSSDSDSKDINLKESVTSNTTKYFSKSAMQRVGYKTMKLSEDDGEPIQSEEPDKHLYFKIPIRGFKKKLNLSLACVHTFVFIYHFTYTYLYCTVPSFELRLQNTNLILYVYNLSFGVLMLIETLTVTFPIKLVYLILPLVVFLVRHLIIRRVFNKGGLMYKNPHFDPTYIPSRFIPSETISIKTIASISILFWILSIPRYVIWRMFRKES